MTILVTGAAGLIGQSIARVLVAEGYAVLGLDVAPNVAEVLEPLHVRPLHVNLSDIQTTLRAIDEALKEAPLAGLVNNAALMQHHQHLSWQGFEAMLRVNLTAPYALSRHLFPRLKATGGAIVNIASTRAHMSEPLTEGYSASKGGLLSLTHALAASFAPHVRVNTISPGWIAPIDAPHSLDDHAQHWSGRVGVPEDIAQLCAYLLGSKAGFITGAEFVADGGMTRKMLYV
ncbi:SDR family oxidoreductase [Sulfurospirillum sp. T05]|uniref:SDR family oxidoreductase n=1 Tax=Sulfurospirillum tamanense TaxID=2813362 RepID=A0ABS2WRG8_9BACT|nr:SDR family oxidoreductase [Sulfurospirillum tamanensis]MBN2964271.1 SDR family oxidoreductase [Sulfurospirillum tamanensis]